MVKRLRSNKRTNKQLASKKQRQTRRHVRIESLQKRELLAADALGIELDSGTYLVAGTNSNDRFEFVAGTTQHTLTLNGKSETVDADRYDSIVFDGGDGSDRAILRGGTSDHTAVINVDDATLVGENVNVRAESVSEVDLYGNGDNDHVTLNGSDGNDRFKGRDDRSQIYGDGFNHEAYGFETSVGNAGGGSDRAYLYGTDGTDLFFGENDFSRFENSSGVENTANGFDRVYAYPYGGVDHAAFVDSDGDDVYKSTKSYATLDTPDTYIKTHDFEMTTATAINGGTDKAYQYDTNGSELLIVSDESVRMLSDEFDTEAIGFERNYSYSRNGGDDYVRVYDTIFSDDFNFETLFDDTSRKNGLEAATDFTRLFSGNFYRKAEGFVVSEMLEVNPRYLIGEVTDGAVDVNADWVNGQADQYFIELQRYGAELIVAGLGISNDGMIDEGIEVIQWGLDQQADDGSFPGTSDAVHSTSFFLHAVGISIEELDRFNYDAFDESMRVEWIDGLDRMAAWMIEVDGNSAHVDLEPFTHRYFLRAAALKRAAMITENSTYDAEADAYLAEGLSRMTADGILPERGGFDINYQSLGLKYAGEFYRLGATESQQAAIADLFVASLTHIESRIDSDGNVDMSDSTRASEDARNGTAKTFDTKNAVRAFLSGYEITQDEAWLELANAVFQSE